MTNSKENTQFLFKWVGFNGLTFVAGLLVSFILGFLIFFGPMGYSSYEDTGTPLEQALMMIAGCIIVGTGLGIVQKKLLSRFFKVSFYWIISIPVALVVVELALFSVSSLVNMEARQETGYVTNVVIFSVYGLVIGLFQFFVLAKYHRNSLLWVLSNFLALGLGTCIAGSVQDDPLKIATFVAGVLVYGIITGLSLLWIFKGKKLKFK